MVFLLAVDMCTDNYVVEDIIDGGNSVDSVVLRISKQQNNCICHVNLQKTVTNYTIFMTKYHGYSGSSPHLQNCGLVIDVEYVDASGTPRPLPSIECTIGTNMRSITLGGSTLLFKSRIIDGNFTRGYCMEIFRSKLF